MISCASEHVSQIHGHGMSACPDDEKFKRRAYDGLS